MCKHMFNPHPPLHRYECSLGGTPRLKFNTTGPVKGVIGGSYSSVSIQASESQIVCNTTKLHE